MASLSAAWSQSCAPSTSTGNLSAAALLQSQSAPSTSTGSPSVTLAAPPLSRFALNTLTDSHNAAAPTSPRLVTTRLPLAVATTPLALVLSRTRHPLMHQLQQLVPLPCRLLCQPLDSSALCWPLPSCKKCLQTTQADTAFGCLVVWPLKNATNRLEIKRHVYNAKRSSYLYMLSSKFSVTLF